ncbi:MAG TPA: ABC transporter permease, partial [Thermoanaerobaculia bacterium]|nr:ABC transporter permease [Thermoanaerobaculia bacterium]
AASLATTLLFALVPTIRTSRTDLRRDLAEGEHGVLARRSGLLDKGLVVFQVGIALVLLVGAGLLIRSFTNLLAVNPGFDARGVLTARVTLPKNQYSEDAQVTQFWHGMVERAEGLPGVESAGLTTDLPLESGSYLTFRVEGRPAPPPDTVQDTVVASAGGDYFRALRIPVLHGRALDPQDDRDGRPVAVVDQAMAQRYWPGLSPIGDRISFGGPWYTVVGIVGSVRTDSLERPSYPHAYLSYLQSPSRSMVLTLRAKSNPGVLVGSLRAALARLDPALPLYSIRTMDDVVERSTMRPRFNLVVLGGFAGAALLLALVGIYGVLSHAVSRRARELGIRRALGADQGVTIRFVLLLGLAPVAAGLVLGLFAALAAERALSSLLFGVSPFDPMTIIVAVIAIALASTVACALPALRAARIDPMEALREE